MCLLQKKKKIEVADEDISVWKIVKNVDEGKMLCLSPIRKIELPLETQLPKVLLEPVQLPVDQEGRYWRFDHGYHAFLKSSVVEWAKWVWEVICGGPRIVDLEVLEATIPKGTRFAINNDGDEIVAETMIIHNKPMVS